jgi:hypothetical protein
VHYLKAILSDLLEIEKQVKFEFYISDFITDMDSGKVHPI